MDVLTPEQRKKCMKKVKFENTRPEVFLRRLLWQEGLRYRKNYKDLPGKPDIAITKYKIAIFVDGEFWHGKDYDGGDYPGRKYNSLREQIEHGNNSNFWKQKIERNMRRDLEIEAELNGLGWKVIRFWSKDVMAHPEECLDVIEETIFEKCVDTR